MDRFELTRVIRYGLLDLSARNGHHAFEEMCRYLVAERIVANVYPATGPVAGGGDAGRDFQTFETHIRSVLGPDGGFAALASGKPVAFACTLQASGLPAKIRRDLKKIAAGPSVGSVYAMVSADLSAAKAAELKAEATDEYGIKLEILDGQALADLLAHQDTFWIASRWLALPAEMAPELPSEDSRPAWYVRALEKWRTTDAAPDTTAELMEVRAALRRATFRSDARSDLGFWLDRMAAASSNSGYDGFRQRARYEVSVAQLRGGGDLRPADSHVSAYFDDLEHRSATWAELLDASVLLQYAGTAFVYGRTSLTQEWVCATRATLEQSVLERSRDKAQTVSQRAGFLDVLGHLRVHVDLRDVEIPAEPLDPIDPLEFEADGGASAYLVPADVKLIDADGAIHAWSKMAALAKRAPLVPIESVATIVGMLAPALAGRDGYRALVDELDGLVAGVAGASAAAERSRDRALAFLNQERPLLALDDLHQAKARWWHGDTVRGALLALMLLSRVYQQLGLFMASRQHALVAAALASANGDDEDGDIIAAGLMAAAHSDYASGSWCTAAEMYVLAMAAHVTHVDDPWDVEQHDDLTAAYLHGGYMRKSADVIDPRLGRVVRELQVEAGLDDVLSELEGTIEAQTVSGWKARVEDSLGTTPWNDIGPDRCIRWNALGIRWEVSAVNRYESSRAAERFAAAAQILCAEMGAEGEDLILLPTTVRVQVQVVAVDPGARPRTRRNPGNDGSDWVVHLMPADGADPNEVGLELTKAVAAVLYEASLLPGGQYRAAVERCFERGLPHKLGAGRPYDDVAAVVDRQLFDRTSRESVPVPAHWDVPAVPDAPPELAKRRGPGPGYDRAEALRFVRNRYRQCRRILKSTLSRLDDDPSFRDTYSGLLASGWLDWHVLLALANARMNFRLELAPKSVADMQKEFGSRPALPDESADEPALPAVWLSAERLGTMRNMAFLTAATSTWNLELHQDTPDIDALVEVLLDRYGFADDDVPHDPVVVEIEGAP